MLEFRLKEVTATLENVNLRTEKNGQDKAPAADLKISCAMGVEVLAFFSADLEGFIFNKNGPRDLADGLPLRDPHLVFPLVRDEEMDGATVKVGYGVGDPMAFPDSKVNTFRISGMNGGTVVVSFRVQCKPDAFKDVPHLYLLQEKGITIWVEPPELPKMKDAA